MALNWLHIVQVCLDGLEMDGANVELDSFNSEF